MRAADIRKGVLKGKKFLIALFLSAMLSLWLITILVGLRMSPMKERPISPCRRSPLPPAARPMTSPAAS